MRATYDAEADAIYVYLREFSTVDWTKKLDRNRLVDYIGDTPVGVELLNVQMGVNLEDVPQAELVAVTLRTQLGR